MMLSRKKLAETILAVAREEDSALWRIAGEGIFHMPELAFAYQCGRAIMENSSRLFEGDRPVWVREEGLGNGGPTDLVFKFDDGNKIAIEFKLRDTSHAYIADIKKLSRLDDNNTLRLFCVLADVYEKDLSDDGRLNAVENCSGIDVEKICKDVFLTKQHRYSSPIYCVSVVWSVGNVPAFAT